MYIPFASLLGLQAALQPLVHKQATLETASAFIDSADFVDPRPGGGSLLDHDSGGLGEPLNVSLFPFWFFPPSFGRPASTPLPSPTRRAFPPCLTENPIKYRLSFRGRALSGSSQTAALCILRTLSDCELLLVAFMSHPAEISIAERNVLEPTLEHRKQPIWVTVMVG
jgi:hypothetical protein